MADLHPSIVSVPMPDRVRRLPVDERGWVVPFFVAWIDGKPDHRIIDPAKMARANRDHLCWMCGERLGARGAFVIGPMCAINRVTSEPPNHRDCAEFALQACPWMTRPHARRRPTGLEMNAPGVAIDRNPGVGLLWITKKWHRFRAGGGGTGMLFALGDPEHVSFWCEGRAATRAEVLASVESGLPLLMEQAEAQEKAEGRRDCVPALRKALARAEAFWPAE